MPGVYRRQQCRQRLSAASDSTESGAATAIFVEARSLLHTGQNRDAKIDYYSRDTKRNVLLKCAMAHWTTAVGAKRTKAEGV